MNRDLVRFVMPVLGLSTALSVAWAAAPVTWHALGRFPEQPLPPQVRQTAERASPADRLAPVLLLAPFGEVAAIEQTGTGAGLSGLVLEGLVLAQPEVESLALISASGSEARPFAVGDSLPGGALLATIAADQVELVANGVRETLRFPANAASSRGAGVAAIRASIPGAANGTQPGPSPNASPEEIVDLYRGKLRDNPALLVGELGAEPSSEGYRLGPEIAPRLRRAGFQSGDIVLRVNGEAVGNIERDRLRFEDVVASGRARVEVRRGDRILTLSFPLK